MLYNIPTCYIAPSESVIPDVEVPSHESRVAGKLLRPGPKEVPAEPEKDHSESLAAG